MELLRKLQVRGVLSPLDRHFAMTLAELGDPRAVAPLFESLNNKYSYVRWEAAKALATTAPAAAPKSAAKGQGVKAKLGAPVTTQRKLTADPTKGKSKS